MIRRAFACLPRSTDAWSCPWFIGIVMLASGGTVAFCYEGLAIPAATSAWLSGYVIGSRRGTPAR